MEENIKFSIIIPMYNSKKYISKCIKSLVKQSYRNFEAIIIDDGSDDGCEKTADKFADKYPYIKVVHQKNSGPSASRKTAVSMADGDYIAFLDSDDWYHPDFLRTAYNELKKDDYAIVQTSYYKVRYPFKMKVCKSGTVVETDISTIKNFINGSGTVDYTLWNKVFRADIIKSAAEKSDVCLRVGEDGYLNLIILSENPDIKISVIDLPLYYYRQGSGVTASKDYEKLFRESMKFKSALYSYSRDVINDKSLMKSIFIDATFIAKYYAHVLTKDIKDKKQCEDIISDVVYGNPVMSEFIDIYKDYNHFGISECDELLKSNTASYYEYLEKSRDEFKKTSVIRKIAKMLK